MVDEKASDSTRVLVTGGFGFIGSHLAELLLSKEDVRVHVVDNLSNNPVDLRDLLSELGMGLFEYKYRPIDMNGASGTEILYDDENLSLTYDICSVADYCTARRPRNSFFGIYHLASVVGPVGVLNHAGHLAEGIILDAVSIANLAIDMKARLVYVSTSEVYGPIAGALSEAESKVIPADITVRLEYAIGKLAAEVALINMAKVANLDVCIVRPFNVAGPRQSPRGGFVIPRFLSQAMDNKPLTVYGDGTQVRAFTHVKDIVAGLVRVMEDGRSGEVYNIGNLDNKTTILELADLVIDVVGSDSKKVFVDPKKLHGPLFAEAADKFPDAAKAKRDLGWAAKIGLRSIVKDAFVYMKEGDWDGLG